MFSSAAVNILQAIEIPRYARDVKRGRARRPCVTLDGDRASSSVKFTCPERSEGTLLLRIHLRRVLRHVAVKVVL